VQPQSVDDFVNENRLDKRQMFRYTERMKNKDWNIVQVGYFETEEQAQAYAKKISGNFSAFKPMVRDMKWLSKHLRQKMLQES
jgi:septal ring-binding cell division protein DamX